MTFTANRRTWAIFLMAVSLALLAVFLFLFLKKVWEDAEQSLRRETGLRFINAVRSIESGVFDQLIVRRLTDGAGADGSVNISIHLPAPERRSDSLKVISFVQEERTEIRMLRRDSLPLLPPAPPNVGKQIVMVTSAEQAQPFQLHADPDNPHISGALSTILRIKSRGEEEDSLGLLVDKVATLPLLEERFGEAMERSGPAVGHRVVQLTADSLAPAQGLVATYTDLTNGERYGAQLTDYQGYLWQKMLPQAAFAALLFGCVALAFGFIFQTLRQQQRLTELKNDLIRNMTHELKTPIATVSVAVEALQNFDALQNPARAREYLDISRHELNRLSLLVDKALQTSLFEQGAPTLQREPLDLQALVSEVLNSMQVQFEKVGAQVEFQVNGEAGFQFIGDRLHLAGVIYNLLDNALKYSPAPAQISINLSRTADRLLLEVADWGRGIPPAFHRRVFEKFFRVPTGDVHDVKGHGLGLSYVAGVVAQHGGSIEVESRVGGGTVFRIAFPMVSPGYLS